MSTATRRALYGKLAGDNNLTKPGHAESLGTPPTGYSQSIYHDRAPQGATWPFIIFSKNSGTPTPTFGDPEAMKTETWLIKAVDRATSADAVEAIADRITTLLNDAALSVAGTTLAYLRHESDVDYDEQVDGVIYKHAGVIVRLVTTP